MIDLMMAHAADEFPNECCGLLVTGPRGDRLVRAKNLAIQPGREFDLDPDAWLEVEDDETVSAVYHSHPNGTSEPSLADKSACESSGLPWHIVGYPGGSHTLIDPSGFDAPYLERPYVHGVHDCYSIVRDWYRRECGVELPDFDRRDGWWNRGENLYVDNFADCGFTQISDEPKLGDLFLMQVGSRKPNHAAIYMGDGTILHHVYGNLSSLDAWGGYWLKHTVMTIRHESRMRTTHG